MDAVADAEGVTCFVGDDFHGTLEGKGWIVAIAGEAEGTDAVFDPSHAEDKVPVLAGIEVGHGDAHDNIGVAGNAFLEKIEDVEAIPLKPASILAGFDEHAISDFE